MTWISVDGGIFFDNPFSRLTKPSRKKVLFSYLQSLSVSQEKSCSRMNFKFYRNISLETYFQKKKLTKIFEVNFNEYGSQSGLYFETRKSWKKSLFWKKNHSWDQDNWLRVSAAGDWSKKVDWSEKKGTEIFFYFRHKSRAKNRKTPNMRVWAVRCQIFRILSLGRERFVG